MKNLKLSIIPLAILCFSILFSGCKKDDDATTPSSTGVALGTLTCKIDGKDFTFNIVVATKTTSAGSTILSVIATNSTASESVTLTLSKYTGAKKYEVDQLAVSTAVLLNSEDLYWGFSDSDNVSTVTITNETSTNIEGTFSFSAEELTAATSSAIIKVTEGKFNAKIQ